MILDVDNLEKLESPGVYKIVNIVNGKYYIGSTKQKVRLRMNHHLQALRNNTHKNLHLQRAWNKYGEDNFKFLVLENCSKENAYSREQYYLDNRDTQLAYNINPNATGLNNAPETLLKLRNARKAFNLEMRKYYQKIKANVISIDEVPNKYKATIIAHLKQVPWNKGKHYVSTEHLKVKHRITDNVMNKYHNFSETLRNAANIVYVYDSNLNFIDSFRSAIDLANLSKFLNLPIKSRFKNKRGKCEINELQSCNINKSIKTGNPYKNLYFMNKPLHPGMDDVNEPKSVKNWNVNTEVNTENKKSVSPYSIEVEPAKAE